MMKQHWVTAALTDDAVVAELLIRMKQPSSLDSSSAFPPPPTAEATSFLPPIRWGNRKSRSKPSAIITTAAAGGGFRKEQQSGSPTTPLYWSGGCGGGGASTSDGYDESSRPSDLSSGGRSTKGGLGNDGATTSNYKKSRKRKSYAQLKEQEDFLLKERIHLNRELESMRVTMNKQIVTSQNLRKLKIEKTSKDERPAQESCVLEPEIKAEEKGFVLPDLNIIPDVEELL